MVDERDVDGWRQVLARCESALTQQGGQAWLTGGGVRDALLGRSPRDVDLAVTADPQTLARLLAPPGAPGAAVIPLRETHGTVRVVLPVGASGTTAQVDLAPIRGGSLLADLRARDFTINAMAWPMTNYAAFVERFVEHPLDVEPAPTALTDPLGGLADLRAKRLRAASATAMSDDPVRVLRGARLAALLDLTPDAATLNHMRAAAPALAREPVERGRDEVWGTLALDVSMRAARGLALLHQTGALNVVLPELTAAPAHLPHEMTSASHQDAPSAATAHAIATVAALDHALEAIVDRARTERQAELRAWLDAWESLPLAAGRPRRHSLRWAALLYPQGFAMQTEEPHDARGQGPRVFKRMGLAKPERVLARTVAHYLDLPRRLRHDSEYDQPDTRVALRYFAATGEAGIETLLVSVAHALADLSPMSPLLQLDGDQERSLPVPHGKVAEEIGQASDWIARFAWTRDEVMPPQLLDGSALVAALDVAPGPEVGRLLAAIRQAQIAGAIHTADQALALARRLRGG